MQARSEPFGVIDGHNDLAWAARIKAGYSVELLAGLPDRSEFHTDLRRLAAGGVAGQFWSVYAEDSADVDPVQYTLEQIDFVYRFVNRYPDQLALARSAEDIRTIRKSGRIAALIGAEGGHSINGSLGTLRMFARLGVRYMTLTHNRNTPWADSATDEPRHSGLTGFGREVVRQMNDLGMLVDLSHVAPSTMHDALNTSRSPVIFSHSSCYSVCAHPRNVPDDVMTRLGENGGVVMVAFVPVFLSEAYFRWSNSDRTKPAPPVTVADVVQHLNHSRDVAGIDHIGIGSDFDGSDDLPDGMRDVTGFTILLGALEDAKWSQDDISKVFSDNILRVLADTDAAFSESS